MQNVEDGYSDPRVEKKKSDHGWFNRCAARCICIFNKTDSMINKLNNIDPRNIDEAREAFGLSRNIGQKKCCQTKCFRLTFNIRVVKKLITLSIYPNKKSS